MLELALSGDCHYKYEGVMTVSLKMKIAYAEIKIYAVLIYV